MPDKKNRSGRRCFLQGAAILPVAAVLAPRAILAAEMPKLELDDPQAKGLNYVHDASEASDNAAFQEGSHCANCLQWTGGEQEWGGCNIFPGKAVHRDGWCSAWAKAS